MGIRWELRVTSRSCAHKGLRPVRALSNSRTAICCCSWRSFWMGYRLVWNYGTPQFQWIMIMFPFKTAISGYPLFSDMTNPYFNGVLTSSVQVSIGHTKALEMNIHNLLGCLISDSVCSRFVFLSYLTTLVHYFMFNSCTKPYQTYKPTCARAMPFSCVFFSSEATLETHGHAGKTTDDTWL